MQTAIPTIIDWLARNFHVIGWVGFLGLAWKASRFLTKVEDRALSSEADIKQISSLASDIKVMRENHLNHMQQSLQKQDGLLTDMVANLSSMDGSLKTLVAMQAAKSRRKKT